MTRRVLLALAAAGAIVIYVALPPRAAEIPRRSSLPSALRGGYHIHTTMSDGSGTPDDVAAAAARAGLSFVILTDHGDGTRTSSKPSYRSGVLVIDAVEISTMGGHVVALGLTQTPYPLAGEPADVLEDLARLGGMSIVAHPTSHKVDLRWHDSGYPYDGVEWLNGDSEWRDEPAMALARILLTYWFRPSESLGLMLDRPAAALDVWDRATQAQNVVGLAGSDAHARIGGDLDHGGPAALNLPSYEQFFRTFSTSLPGLVLTGDAPRDAAAILAAIRAGHVFTTIDAFARPGQLSFTATRGSLRADAGDRVASGEPVSFRVETAAPPGASPVITLYRNGVATRSASGEVLTFDADGATAAYRAEVSLPQSGHDGTPAPWLVSNPIYIGPAATAPPADTPKPAPAASFLYRDGPPAWTVEHSSKASGAIDVVGAAQGTQLLLRWALGGALADGPFVAFAADAGRQIAEYERLTFAGRSNRPMRVSVQLRASAERGGGRWRRSVYLDDSPRVVSLPLSTFKPTRAGLPETPPIGDISSLLFVIDTVNTALGTNGQFWIDDVGYAR